MANRKTKRMIVKKARKLVKAHFPSVAGSTGACLYLSWAVCSVAREHKINLLMMAGSAYWPRVTSETDDGVEANRFGYEWDPIEAAPHLAADIMPELHVWAGDPLTGEIIDLSTGDWPKQCLDVLGVPWKAPSPPAFFWAPASSLPALAEYRATKEAGETALRLISRAIGGGHT